MVKTGKDLIYINDIEQIKFNIYHAVFSYILQIQYDRHEKQYV